jgi:NitT/TauT family transport system substrate-binding protein
MIEQAVDRRTLIRGGLVLSAAGLVAACSSSKGGDPSSSSSGSGPETPTVTAGWSAASGATGALWLAAAYGLFKKYGLTVKVVESGSTAGATAVIAGQSQFYYGEGTSAFQAVAQSQPVEIVATFRDLNVFKFIGGKDVTSASQLKGKSLAISSVGDSTDLSTRTALSKLGVDPNSVTLLPTGTSSARLAALLTGKVAATMLTEPSASQSIEQGCHLLLDQTKEPFVGSAVMISKSFGSSNPKTVLAFLKGMVEAVKFMDDPANKQKCLTVFAKYLATKVSDPVVLLNYNQYSPAGALVRDPYPSTAGGNAILAALRDESSSRFGKLTLAQVYDTTWGAELRSSGFLTSVWGSQLNVKPSPTPSVSAAAS